MKLKIMDIDLLVPCRRFSIDYSYTDKRQLPILSEYALKLCYELDTLNSSILCNFFGISQFEASILIDKLVKDSLVTFNNEFIELTPYCRQRFDEASGDTTRFFEYKDDSAVIAMELNNYGILPPSFKYISDSLIYGLPIIDPEALVDVNKKATGGFSKNYSYYLKEFKSEQSLTTHNELYKVGNISVKDDGLIQIGAEVSIDSKNFMLSTEVSNVEIYENIDTDYLCDQLNEHTIIDDQSGGEYKNDLLNHCEVFDDAFISEFTRSDKIFDLVKAMKEYVGKWLYPDQLTSTIIGYHYNYDNQLRIRSLLESVNKDIPLNQNIDSVDSLMLINPYSALWGKSRMLYEFGKKVTRPQYSLLGNLKPGQVNDAKQFFRSFSTPVSINEYVFSNRTFCLLAPGRFAIAQYYFPHPSTGKLYIPIGYVTTNSDKLIKISKALCAELEKVNILGNGLPKKNERDSFDSEQLQKGIRDWLSNQSFNTFVQGSSQLNLANY